MIFRKLSYLVLLTIFISCTGVSGDKKGILFLDSFENNLDKWQVSNYAKIKIMESGNAEHGKVLALSPGGNNIHILIKNSNNWTNIRVEGDVFFPEDEHNYMGFIYNYNINKTRDDYGCIYIKGNGSYVVVNPHRDALVSRTIYAEYRTPLTGESAIKIGEWQRFKAEIMGTVCHFYVGDMSVPKITYNFHEFSSGNVGFEPRVYGSDCWIDNIEIRSINEFNYRGGILPDHIKYNPEEFITDLDAIGPFRKRIEEIENETSVSKNFYNINNSEYRWEPFEADGRGCVITGRVFEFGNQKWYAYFKKQLNSKSNRKIKLQFSTTNIINVWLNGKFVGEVQPTYFAWYDFPDNPDHLSGEVELNLKEGENYLLILAQGVGTKYTGDGFYAHIKEN